MEKLYRIYLITNKLNYKKYIGQTDGTIEERFNNHCRSARKAARNGDNSCYLHNSIAKYGPDNFTVELVEDNITEDMIDDKETFYISKYDTFYRNGNGYNMTTGGQGVHGYVHTDETKEKMREASKKWWKDLRENNSEGYLEFVNLRGVKHRGWKPTDETIERMKASAYPREGELNPFYGKTHSTETKKVLSESQSISVSMFSLNGDYIKDFSSSKEAAKYVINNGLTSSTSVTTVLSRITKVVREEAKSAYGYIWKRKCID